MTPSDLVTASPPATPPDRRAAPSAPPRPSAVPALVPVDAPARAALAALPRTREAHDAAMSALAAFGQVETGGTVAADVPDGPLRVASWNLERCLYPDAAARLLARHGASLALLTEMDWGMHRTGQHHTTRRLAATMHHAYAYGLEFLELEVMPSPIEHPNNLPGNLLGFHGNGFSSAVPFRDPATFRLDAAADWFVAPRGGQRRVGGRAAVAATFHHGGRDFVACAVHLESDADPAGRARQMATLLDALDDYAAGLPVLLGGDLNTRLSAGHRAGEPLFDLARRRGYDWDSPNRAAPTTRRSTWSAGRGDEQLDWFAARDLRVSDPAVVPAISEDGTPLSDHELILVTLHLN